MGLKIGQQVTVKNIPSIATYVHGATGEVVEIKEYSGQQKMRHYLIKLDTPLTNPVSVLTHMHFLISDLE
jgi:hypothetical protein